MSQILLAAFHDKNQADKAINQLEAMGYNPKDISIIAKDKEFHRADREAGNGGSDASGVVSGMATGGALGGLAGLLAGAGVLPVLAGLFIGGPIALAVGATGIAATAISGAVTGALAGGLLGALVDLGIPKEEAQRYNDTVESGGVVIGVPLTGEEGETRDILRDNGADEITDLKLHEPKEKD